MSTYVGYLGQLVNAAVGVPFGAGQFMSGLHVIWIMLAAGLVRKPGAASLTGLLKGMVEFLIGSTHGIVIVLVSLTQGLLVDGWLTAARHRSSLFLYCLAGGTASASNVVVFQLLYFSGVPLAFLLLLVVLAFSSGIIFAGYFGKATIDLLAEARVARLVPPPQTSRLGHPPLSPPPPSHSSTSLSDTVRHRVNLFRLSAVLFLIALAMGAGLYAVAIWRPALDPSSCDVEGMVARPYRFTYAAFAYAEITIEAELVGTATHIPAQNYTGIPLSVILSYAQPDSNATTLLVVASDGYTAIFSLEEVMSDEGVILTLEQEGLRLVARGYPGAYWVERVIRLVVS